MSKEEDIFSLERIQKITEQSLELREILREEEAKDVIKWIIFEIEQRAKQGYEYFSYVLHGKKCDYVNQIVKYFKAKDFSVVCNPTYLVDRTINITIDWSKKPSQQKKGFFKKFFNLKK